MHLSAPFPLVHGLILVVRIPVARASVRDVLCTEYRAQGIILLERQTYIPTYVHT